MHRTREEQRIHDALLEKVVSVMTSQRKYFELQAQLEEHKPPGKVKWKGEEAGQVPDAQAQTSGGGVVVEVETKESIFDEHTRNQWRLFSKFARAKGLTFWIVVPKGSEDLATMRAMELKLKRYKVYGIKLEIDGKDGEPGADGAGEPI